MWRMQNPISTPMRRPPTACPATGPNRMKPGPLGPMATSPLRATLPAPALLSISADMTTGVSLMKHVRFLYTQKGPIGRCSKCSSVSLMLSKSLV